LSSLDFFPHCFKLMFSGFFFFFFFFFFLSLPFFLWFSFNYINIKLFDNPNKFKCNSFYFLFIVFFVNLFFVVF